AEWGGEEAGRREVEALLGHQGQLGSFLEQFPDPPRAPGAFAPSAADEPAPAAGAPGGPPAERGGPGQPEGVLAGRYKLLEPIGEGGMGTVWMAQQTEPVKRLVAVKLIK